MIVFVKLYELTSKYNFDNNHWSNIKYYPAQVDHVVFDVQLGLKPIVQKISTYSDGVWGTPTVTDLTGQAAETRESVKFTMDHQAVLDAYNKCPNHTGLDFTIMANSALIEFDLNKELTGGEVQANQFAFRLSESGAASTDEYRVEMLYNANDINTIEKSRYETLAQQGYHLIGGYRIFYKVDNDPAKETRWGDGIDGEAVLAELQGIAGYENVSTIDTFLYEGASARVEKGCFHAGGFDRARFRSAECREESTETVGGIGAEHSGIHSAPTRI